jgi:hypothetical protein
MKPQGPRAASIGVTAKVGAKVTAGATAEVAATEAEGRGAAEAGRVEAAGSL